jgi:hypothetical protein
MDWIVVAQEKDRWQTLVNGVMNLRVHKVRRISCLADDVLASQERRCSMDYFS